MITVIALQPPYCVRAYHEPIVSTPLEWKEVKNGLNPEDFNIKSVVARLKKKKDLWAGILQKKVMLSNGRILLKSVDPN